MSISGLRKSTFYQVLLLTLIATFVLSACNTPAAPTSEAETDEPEATDAATEEADEATEAAPEESATEEEGGEETSSEGNPELVLWVYDDGRLEVLTELGAQFEEEYGVAVKVEVVDLGEIRNAMTLGAASG